LRVVVFEYARCSHRQFKGCEMTPEEFKRVTDVTQFARRNVVLKDRVVELVARRLA
jgi:hypothetical protein